MRLKDYRGVADSAVDFATQGVTIIEGDNEVGKTCIPEALDLILTELDSSGKRRVKDIKPVHRDAGPKVEATLSSGPYRFEFTKRWLRKPQTILNVSSPKREQLTGREAHQRVRQILAETLDQDLWDALRIEQGAPLNLPDFASSSLGAALDRAAGGDAADSQQDGLWKRVEDERLQYWTPTGRESQQRKGLKEEVATAQGQVEELGRQLGDVEKDAMEMARLVEDERRLTVSRDEAAKVEQELDARRKALEQLRSEVRSKHDRHEAAQARHQEVIERQKRRQALIKALQSSMENLSALEDGEKKTSLRLQPAKERDERAASALKAARSDLGKAEDALRLANEDQGFHRELIEKKRLSKCYADVQAARKELGDALATIQSSQVDDDLVDGIAQANIKLEVARSTRDTSSARVETTALSRLKAMIDGEEVELEANATRSSLVSDDWELAVPDVFRIRVQPGNELRELASEADAAEQAFKRLCAQGGVDSLDEARRKAKERSRAEQRRDQARKSMKLALQDQSLEELAQQVESLTSSTAAYPDRRVGDSPLPGSFDDAKRTASTAEKAVAVRRDNLKQCEEKAEQARNSLRRIENEAAELRGRVSNARSARERAREDLATARQERSDSDLNAKVDAETEQVSLASAALREAKEALEAEDPESLEAKLNNVRDAKERAKGSLRKNQDRQHELAGRLEGIGEAGLHSKLSDAKRKLAHLQRDHQRAEARAQAALLLFETFDKHRQAARQHYVAPFKARIERLGRIVFGPTFEAELGSDLKVERRTLDGITLDFEQLSVGAQEQLGVICRLACAAIVSASDGGAPVVLDDALGWSDPQRLQAMGAAISAAGRDCQVIILTCTPGRYAHVGNAEVVRLRA